MAKLDPSTLTVSSRLIKDEDAAGIILDESGDWKSGRVEILLTDKYGNTVGAESFEVTRAKYAAWREDFDGLTAAKVVSTYFDDVEVGKASTTELDDEIAKSQKEQVKREAEVAKAEEESKASTANEAEEVDVTYTDIDADGKETTRTEKEKVNTDFENVRPVGDPDVTPSNPEQKIFAPEAKKIADAGKEVKNPEQSAPNVPEDEFKTKGGNTDEPSVTTKVPRDVKPVGADAKTNKEVEAAK